MGNPPALPGRQDKFDFYRSPSKRLFFAPLAADKLATHRQIQNHPTQALDAVRGLPRRLAAWKKRKG